MTSDDFEWDNEKAALNVQRHKVSFEMAREAFADPFIVEWVDEGSDHNEQRFVALAMVEDRLLFVSYTLRGEGVRNYFSTARRAVGATQVSQ